MNNRVENRFAKFGSKMLPNSEVERCQIRKFCVSLQKNNCI